MSAPRGSIWPVVFATPLDEARATARLRAVTEPWPSALSRHVGPGGRYLYGDHSAAGRFEGEIDGGRFRLQRIHYRGASHGPRMWSEGEIVGTPTGAEVRLRHRPRLELYVYWLVWTVVLFGLTGLGIHLGFGDRLPTVLAGVAAIYAIAAGLLVLGLRMERRICTALFRDLLDGR